MTLRHSSLKISKRLKPLFSAALVAALLLSVFLNTVALGWQVKVIFRREPNYCLSAYVGTDMPRELPLKVRNVNMVFHDDPDHYAMAGDAAWAEWNAMRPPGNGFIYLGNSHYAFGVAMWHQLGCLNHLRAVIVNGDDGGEHTEHCFHYLRQSILCAGDITLEGGGTSRAVGSEKVATGVNVTHTCKDWRQIYDYMEAEYFKWTPDMHERIKESSDGTNNHIFHGGHKGHR